MLGFGRASEQERDRTLRYPGIHALYGYLRLAHDQPSQPQSLDRCADYAVAGIRLDTLFLRGGTTGHGRMAASYQTSYG